MVNAFSGQDEATEKWFCAALHRNATRQFAIRVVQASTSALGADLLSAVVHGILTDENDQEGPLMVGFRRACLEVAVAAVGPQRVATQLEALSRAPNREVFEAAIGLIENLPPAQFLRGKAAT